MEDAKLGGGELYRQLIDDDEMLAGVDDNAPTAHHGLALAVVALATQHGLEPCRQHTWAERFGHVVCRPELETGDDICLAALGREHDDGDLARRWLGLKAAAPLEP